MSLKDRIGSKSKSAIKRETLTLPVTGEEVCVRSLMSGPAQRMSNEKPAKQNTIAIALATEDPETGELLWNANDQDDHESIEALPLDDSLAIVEVINRISYIGKKAAAVGKENSSGEGVEEEEKTSPTY